MTLPISAPSNNAGRCPHRRGFTLFELLLAMAIFAASTGLLTVHYAGWLTRASWSDGVERFETAVRMARAEATATGKRVRLVFDLETGQPGIEIELDPLAEPNVFVAAQPSWLSLLQSEAVRVTRCELVGPSAFRTMVLSDAPVGGESEGDDAIRQAVLFLPDGSSDSAVIELAPTTPDATSRAVIDLDGVLGRVESRRFTASEWEQYNETQDANNL